uniref:Uncharacterized protein n=1 Tax=Cacopsylla melanoneura TaxID=428564 RepID=A0A8D9BPS8_9HEMI
MAVSKEAVSADSWTHAPDVSPQSVGAILRPCRSPSVDLVHGQYLVIGDCLATEQEHSLATLQGHSLATVQGHSLATVQGHFLATLEGHSSGTGHYLATYFIRHCQLKSRQNITN